MGLIDNREHIVGPFDRVRYEPRVLYDENMVLSSVTVIRVYLEQDVQK